MYVASAGGCGSGWVKSGMDGCYKFVTQDKKTWTEARGMCQDMGGDLVSLETMDEIYWIRGYRSYHSALRPEWLWLGGYRVDNKWMWKGKLADTPIGITDWAGTEPQDIPAENCLAMFGDEKEWPATHWFRWLNIACDYKYGYICEKSMT